LLYLYLYVDHDYILMFHFNFFALCNTLILCDVDWSTDVIK